MPAIYAASFAKPAERLRLLTTDTNALYAPAATAKSYLLWLRGGTLVAQEFDPGTLKLAGEPHPVADPVARCGLSGQMNVAVSASGVLLYSASNTLSQFTWFDRAGKPLGVVGEPGEYTMFRLSPDGRRVVASRDRAGSSRSLAAGGGARGCQPVHLQFGVNTVPGLVTRRPDDCV